METYFLRAEIRGADARFFIFQDGREREPVGPVLDASNLSDDYGVSHRFTGMMTGLCAQDIGGTKLHADFDYFAETPLT